MISSSEEDRVSVSSRGRFNVDYVGCFDVDGVCYYSLRPGFSPLWRSFFRGIIGDIAVLGVTEVVSGFCFCCGR